MIVIYINFCWAVREMLKPEPESSGTQHLPSCPVDVNVSEKKVLSFIVFLLL